MGYGIALRLSLSLTLLIVKKPSDMYVKQLYTGCLAEAAYYVESNGEAAIIDPLRDTQVYQEMAQERGAKIKYVLETHFHADFVSGHLDLAQKTGAKIVYGPTAEPNFDAYVAEDHEVLPLGEAKFVVLHTPGHTMESVTFLLKDESGKNEAIFTGDTLFIGDVGRPDLAVKSDLSREDLARHLYQSLRQKIMPLEDDIIVYPGHGQGSACGKNMSSETTDTLGSQKENNYALDPKLSEDAFIEAVTDGLVTPPQYFPKNAVLNKTGYEQLDSILEKSEKALDVESFDQYRQEGNTLILDTRYESEFMEKHIPNSLYIGLHDNFAPWVGALIEDLQTPLLIIAHDGKEEEVITRLARVGYDNALGYLQGGIAAWEKAGKALTSTPQLKLDELAARWDQLQEQVVDVRKVSEYEAQHLQGVRHIALDFMPQEVNKLAEDTPYYLHCAGGYRSVIAASILERHGRPGVSIEGGFNAMGSYELPMTETQTVDNML
jgi:glyoxylase-like metal-dependent hydrolase (beta-lactamase superfamily II)/rhodanese-related sulfurtransferase